MSAYTDDVYAALARLGGTEIARISLLTGLTADELADLGGLDDLA